MKTLGLLIICVIDGLTCLAMGEFGEFQSVRQVHPEFFKPGVVEDALLGDVPWYVYCGEAEKCFNEEQDSELYEEAEVQAKLNFYSFFQNKAKNPAVKVEVSTARKLYQFVDGKMYYVVLGVPKSGVTVSAPVAKPTPPVIVNNVVKSQPIQQPVSTPVRAADNILKPQLQPSPVATSAVGVPVADAPVDAKKTEDMDDAEKLKILRARLATNPGDFRVRIRMARIFDAQKNERRALRNYADAARLLVLDKNVSIDEKIDTLHEIAAYEEGHGAGALALKHYRVLQRMGGNGASIATGRISRLLLQFK